MNMFKGVGVALVTPFQSNGQVDFNGLQRLVEHQINNGTDYLVVQGTTGESATLSSDEKKAVLDFIIEINAKRLPIVLGIGGNNTAAVVDALKSTDLKDVDGILSVSPYYNKPSQEGIYQHYKTISAATSKPIILYNVPGRTMSNVLAQTTLRIARDCKKIVAVKEASGNLEQVMEIINNKPEGFVVLSGDDALTLPHMAIGGDGVISVVANAFPKRFSMLVHAAMENNMDLAREKHYELFEVIQQLFADGNPGGVKHVLKLLNICDDNLRLPLVPVRKDVADKLYALTAKIGEKVV
jgi:4-hydroxy-tetrahydrodipicolinate synthase